MDLLAVLLPQVRAQILRLLFADASSELHLRELTRRSGLALGTIQTELAKLTEAQLVVSERDGNRLYYRANAGHPLFPVLRQLVLQTTDADSSARIADLAGSATPATAHRSPTRRPPARKHALNAASGRPTSVVPPPPPATLTLNEFD